MTHKVEIDLDAHAEKLRAYETAKERLRIASNRVRNLERELSTARYECDDASTKLNVLASDVAASMLETLLPSLNEPRAVEPAIAAPPETES